MQHRVKTAMNWSLARLTRCALPASCVVVACMSLGAGRARGAAVHVGGADPPADAPSSRAAVPQAMSPPVAIAALGDPEAFACPRETLPDGNACVRLPDADDAIAPEAESNTNAHRDRQGRWVVYDDIPRRPDRTPDYDAYRYPVPCSGCVGSGFDLDRADAEQRRGRRLRQVGHGAVDLLVPRGTPVTLVNLEHQRGDAEVVYVGPLFGTTVVTRHTVREGAGVHDYLLLYGHLDAAAPGVHAGAIVGEGDALGVVGDSGSPGIVHLHLEVRRARDTRDARSHLSALEILSADRTVVCDPRNVLPTR